MKGENNMKRKVTVKINYCRFDFGDDVQEAVDFADTAARTADRDDKDVQILIDYEREEDES